MHTIKNIKRHKTYQVKAFTLVESLLTLAVISFLVIGLSSSVQTSFEQVEQQLFFIEFENIYKETQERSLASQQESYLTVAKEGISNGRQNLSLPKSVELLEDREIRFDKQGGNSSLAKIRFKTRNKKIEYQLYIGNGKFKKTED